MSFECFLTIYCIGLVVLPVAFGIWKPDVVKKFETDDYINAVWLIALWPVVVLVFGIVLVCGIIYYTFYAFGWLFKVGVLFREYLIRRRRARKLENTERE